MCRVLAARTQESHRRRFIVIVDSVSALCNSLSNPAYICHQNIFVPWPAPGALKVTSLSSHVAWIDRIRSVGSHMARAHTVDLGDRSNRRSFAAFGPCMRSDDWPRSVLRTQNLHGIMTSFDQSHLPLWRPQRKDNAPSYSRQNPLLKVVDLKHVVQPEEEMRRVRKHKCT